MSAENALLVSLVAAVVGALVQAFASRFIDWWKERKNEKRQPAQPDIRGDWNSQWGPLPAGPLKYSEVIHITHQEGMKVAGWVSMKAEPGKIWIVEGRFDGQFLQMYYYPKDDLANFIDFGCYFFVRQPEGKFIGHSSGFGNYVPGEAPETSTDYHELSRHR